MPLTANLPERYEPVRLLGSGGMGSVFEVYDRVLERHVALKVLARVEPVNLYRFKQEFRALADVSHENLVTLHELSFDAGTWFFTMELVRGSTLLPYVRPGTATARFPPDRTGIRAQVSELPTLAERAPRIAEVGALSVDRLRDALAQLCEGLQQLHALGFVHRDIKPSNILVDVGGRIVLCDFGLVAETHDPGLGTHIERGLVAGTLSYMAPEQMLGQPVTPACDWYALGVLLFQALTARLPFEGDRAALIEWKQLGAPTAPREIDPEIPQDLDRLCVALMSSAPEARVEAAASLRRVASTPERARPGLRLPPRLVGRETELGALVECRARPASTCLVIGATGLGKSRLLHEIAERSRRAGDLVLATRCRAREQVPFNALDGIIDELSGWLTTLSAAALADLLPSSAGLLARLFPLFAAHVASSEAAAPSDPVEQRLAAANSLRELLSSIAERRRVAVIIDDAHRMDRDSESLLADLVRPPDPPRILLVCSALEAPPMFREAGLAPRIVELPPLTREQSEMLAAELFEARSPSSVFLSDAARAAHGVPRRLVELAEAVLPVEGGIELGVRLASAKLAELSPPALDLLVVLAFARVPLSTPLALKASGVPLEAVAQLRSRHLIRLDGPFSEGELEIEDTAVAEAARDHPDPEAARGIHEGLAIALDGGKHFEALAFHWDAAGRRDRALYYAILAADRAAEQLAFDHAATWYQTALGWAQDGARHSLRVALGETLANAGRGKAAADAFLEAAREAPDDSFELHRRAARQLLISGHTHDGLTLVSRLCRAIGVDVPRTRMGSVARLLTKRAQIALRGVVRRRTASPPDPNLGRAVDLCWEASMGTSVVDPVRAAFFQAAQLDLALTAGDDWRTARAYALEAGLRSVRGTATLGVGERWLARARKLAPKTDPDLGGLIPLSAGVVAYLEGRFEDSVKLCAQAESHFVRNAIGATWEIDTAASFGSWSSFYAGRIAELRAQTIVRFRDADARGNLYSKNNLASVLALSRIMADEADLARRELDDLDGKWVTRGLNVQHYNTILGFVVIALYQGRAEEALARMLECFLGLRRAFLLGVEPLRIVSNYFLGTAALAALSHGSDQARRERVAIARRAERRLSREHAEYGRALGRLLRAGLATEAQDARLACRELRSARDGFRTQEMRLFEHVAESRRLDLVAVPSSAERDANAAWFVSEGIVAPSRVIAVFAPFPE